MTRLRALLVLLVTAVAITPAHASSRFPRRFFHAPIEGPAINGLATGDVDGDGHVDLLAENGYEGSFSLFLGLGDGTLVHQGDYTFEPNNSQSFTLADIDGDHRADAVIASYTLDEVTVRPGLALGGFGDPRVLVSVPRPTALACADLNGDGRPDLVVTSNTNSKVYTYLQQPDGTFSLKSAGNASNPLAVALADFDADGHPDVVVLTGIGEPASKAERVFLNDGSGGLVLTSTYAIPTSQSRILTGDINGDGHPDWMVGTQVMYRVGDGTFTQGASPSYNGGAFNVVALADMNRDGFADLILAGHPVVLAGSADDSFPQLGYLPSPENQTCVAVADFDEDGIVDLASASTAHPGIAVTHSNGNGTFGVPAGYVIPLPWTAAALAVGDLNADGRPDLVVGGGVPAHYDSYLSDPTGAPVHAGSADASRGPASFTLGDMNGDGRPDLVTLLPNPGALLVYLTQPDGSFVPLTEHPTATATPYALSAGDVNRDHAIDVVVGEDRELTTHLGAGDGNFLPGFSVSGAVYTPRQTDLDLVDVDANGYLDAIVRDYNTASVYMYPGNGAGPYFQPGVLETPPTVGIAGILDVDGDGTIDIATMEGGMYEVYPGDGHGNFGTPISIDPGAYAGLGVFADIDGDGLLDLIMPRPGLNMVSVLFGLGQDQYGRREDYGLDGSPQRPRIGDFNGDGRPDIAIDCDGELLVLLQSAGTVAAGPLPSATRIALSAPVPNPARGSVSFSFTMPAKERASVAISNVSGRLVRELASGALEAGQRRMVWDGKETDGSSAPAGVYFVRVLRSGEQASRKFVLLR